MREDKNKLMSGSICMAFLATILVVPSVIMATTVPDTGQTKCYDIAGNVIACPQPGQALFGQDARYSTHPPSYTKLDLNGNDLLDSATEWAMIIISLG